MKQGLYRIAFILVFISFVNSSIGAVIYHHTCNTMNVSQSSLTKPTCDMDHQMPSCHQEDQDPCCEDQSQFDTQEQQVNTVPDFGLTPIAQTILVEFSPIIIEEVEPIPFGISNLPRPPNLRYCILYEQILC